MRRLAALAPLLLLSGCSGMVHPASEEPVFDPAQAPGRMTIEEAEEGILGAQEAFLWTLCKTRQNEIRLLPQGLLWSFVMGQGQDLQTTWPFLYKNMEPKVRPLPVFESYATGQKVVIGRPWGIRTGTDVLFKTTPNDQGGIVHAFTLQFDSLEEAKSCSEALWLLQRRAAGEKVPGWLDRGAAALQEGRRDEAKADAVRLLEHDPRLAVAFAGKDPLSILDLEARRKAGEEALTKAKSCEAAGDVPGAFRNFLLAYGMAVDGKGTEDLVGDLWRLYPKLKDKPPMSESCRRLLVQAEALMDAKRYREALDALGKATWAEPCRPEIWFNLAMIRGEGEGYKDPKAAIQYMGTYLKLAPDAADARKAQDKIYAWEALGGK